MKTVILAGGFGTRLAEYTDKIPKPMVQIGDKPILSHIMNFYQSYGHDEFIVAAGYKKEVITEYYKNSKDFKNLTIVDTGENTMTGGRILRLKSYFDKNENFFMTYGDGLCSINLDSLIQFHLKHKKIASVTAVHPPVRFGELEIKGDDYELILETANNLKAFINAANIPGIEELKLDIDQGKPELLVSVDRQKARRLGVSTGQIGANLRTALYGKEVSTYKDLLDDYPINIRLNEKFRYNRTALLNQKITFRDQGSGQIKQVPISAIATTENQSSFSAVKRIDLDRVVTLYSNVLNDYNPTQVNDNIRELITDFEIPKGVNINFTGEQEKQAKEMAFLSKALLIAVSIIFLILVAQFNSATTPIIISISVFLSLIGVLFGLLIFRMDFVILMTMIGIISLAGIVVNNAIVLIDYINLIIARKRKELNLNSSEKLSSSQLLECVVEGGKTRLRPVLLTAMTTILGLLPLALGININFKTLVTELNPNFYIGGENVAFWGPMGWAIIYGLTFATFLTLVVVPILYYLINKIKTKKVNVAS